MRWVNQNRWFCPACDHELVIRRQHLPTNTRREKLQHLNNILEVCHRNQLTYRTSALADKIATIIRPLGFGQVTEKEYIRKIVDALAWELSNEKEFKFADA